jgi:hypothetical protein
MRALAIVSMLLAGCGERALDMPEPASDLGSTEDAGACPSLAPFGGGACAPEALWCGYGCGGTCICHGGAWQCMPGLC